VAVALVLLLGGASCQNTTTSQKPVESGPPQPATPEAFDGARAFDLLTRQCDFGPRVPGSDAHTQCGDWLLSELGSRCDRAWAQAFTHQSTGSFPGRSFAMRNLLGMVEPAGGRAADTREVLLLAHWDSRPFANHDPLPANRTKPVPGANDGASGVAVALELARCLRTDRGSTAVVILLTDGEDFGLETDPDLPEYFLGSKYFAQHLGDLHPKRGILLDMVGDKTAAFGREGYSYRSDPALVERIWSTAAGLGRERAFTDDFYTVADDHLPLISAGIPTVDIIDWRPEVVDTYWHTVADTPDKCSAESLQAVGEVVLAVLRKGI
jgi:hypothetical protein